MREKTQDARPNTEQADVDKLIAACLAKMGEVAFSDAYDQGQAMTLDEAVRFAVGEEEKKMTVEQPVEFAPKKIHE